MNAGKRWAYHFVSELECVRCRCKGDLTLISFRDRIEKVDSESLTPKQLKGMVPKMDVWCQTCDPIITTRVTSQGRLNRKEEAARMADIRFGAQKASLFDVYHIEGHDWTKHQLEDALKSGPCMKCGRQYYLVAKSLYHPTKRLSTIQQILDNLDESVVLCLNCMAYIKNSLWQLPNPIVVDENFWSSLKATIE